MSVNWKYLKFPEREHKQNYKTSNQEINLKSICFFKWNIIQILSEIFKFLSNKNN